MHTFCMHTCIHKCSNWQNCEDDDTCLANRAANGKLAERPNERFFQFQRQQFEERSAAGSGSGFFGLGAGNSALTGLDKFEANSLTVVLREEILGHVAKYLTSLGQAVPQDPKVFMWASVHSSCVGHLPHVHEVGASHI